jgi:hypothetical protein
MEVTVLLLPSLAGTIVVFLFYWILRVLGFNGRTSLVTSCIYGFSTLSWFEATHLQSHILSAALVSSAAYVVIRMKHYSQRDIVIASTLLALSCMVEIQNIVFTPAFVIYLMMAGKAHLNGKSPAISIIISVLVFAAAYAVVLGYNYAAFGELTLKSNKYNPNFPEENSFATSLSGNPLTGLDKLSIGAGNIEALWDFSKGTKNAIPGLFVVTPIFLLSLLGAGEFWRRHKNEAILFGLIIAAEVAVVAVHKTVLTRHISPIYPLLFIPAAYYVQKAVDGLCAKRQNIIPAVVVFSLSAYSAYRVFYAINTYWSRELEYPFPFLDELPTYTIFYGMLIAAYFGAKTMRRD